MSSFLIKLDCRACLLGIIFIYGKGYHGQYQPLSKILNSLRGESNLRVCKQEDCVYIFFASDYGNDVTN